MMPKSKMPALFIGHGSPMNAIQDTVYTAAWIDVARSIPRPEAILCISAHWETAGTFVTATERPPTIHDFQGFPDELFQVQYPAPGSPWLAQRVSSLVAATRLLEHEASPWGLDHGAWSVLLRMYPEADIPVVQLSLDRSRPPRSHYELGCELQALREEGVLILGSGNIVHNLGMVQWGAGQPYPWAEEFDMTVAGVIMAGDHDRLVDYAALGEPARLSIPTNEHYLPLLYVLALQQAGEKVSFFAQGVTLGSISMRSLRIG